MKKLFLIFLCLVLTLSLCSCKPKDNDNSTLSSGLSETNENNIPDDINFEITKVSVKTETEEKSYGVGGVTYFTASYSYPVLSAENYQDSGIADLNAKFKADCIDFFEEIEGELFEKEREAFSNHITDDELPAGKIVHSYEIGFNTNNIFSLIETESFDLQTKNGIREKGQTFEIFGGKEMGIESFIPMAKEDIDDIVKSFFIKTASESPEEYFENAEKIINSAEFDYQFYLTESGVYIFLPYDYIAPRSFGRPNCFLSFRDITEIKRPS